MVDWILSFWIIRARQYSDLTVYLPNLSTLPNLAIISSCITDCNRKDVGCLLWFKVFPYTLLISTIILLVNEFYYLIHRRIVINFNSWLMRERSRDPIIYFAHHQVSFNNLPPGSFLQDLSSLKILCQPQDGLLPLPACKKEVLGKYLPLSTLANSESGLERILHPYMANNAIFKTYKSRKSNPP